MDILVASIWLQLALHNVVNEISKLYISLISCEQTARIFPRSQASISKPLPPHAHMNTSKETHLSPQNLIGWCDDARRLMFPYVMSHRLIILRTSILHLFFFCCMRPFDRCQLTDFKIKEKKRRDIQVWILFASHLQTEYISAELWMCKNQYVLFIGLLWTDHLL